MVTCGNKARCSKVTERRVDLSRVLDQIRIGVAVTTPEGEIEYANPHLCRMLGLEPGRLAGANLADFGTPGSAVQRDRMRLRLLAGESWQEEAQFRAGTGDVLHLLESVYPLRDAEGSVALFAHFLQDLGLLKISETLRNLAFYDGLTGLPNRNLFRNRLALALATARRARHGFALLSADIDRFHLVNEALGRDAGDELLRQVAARLRACLREIDTVARLGRDEFVVILDRVLDPELASKTADKLRSACCGDYELHGNRLRVTLSVGLSQYPRDGQDADVLLERADLAMYRAKAAGRDCFQLRDPGPKFRYGFPQEAELLNDDSDRVADVQARSQLRRRVNDPVAVDEHRTRYAHARRSVFPAVAPLDENRLGCRIR
jgi:diguanylate cyclase (GGDEF)-like protein/PAS domain S-box-containing protein